LKTKLFKYKIRFSKIKKIFYNFRPKFNKSFFIILDKITNLKHIQDKIHNNCNNNQIKQKKQINYRTKQIIKRNC
jgi:hypothetical protein